MEALISDLDAKMAQARLGGGPRATERMRSKGKKLPRERYVAWKYTVNIYLMHMKRQSKPSP